MSGASLAFEDWSTLPSEQVQYGQWKLFPFMHPPMRTGLYSDLEGPPVGVKAYFVLYCGCSYTGKNCVFTVAIPSIAVSFENKIKFLKIAPLPRIAVPGNF